MKEMEQVYDTITEHGFRVTGKKEIANGLQLKLSNGSCLNLFHNGTVQTQGKNAGQITALVEALKVISYPPVNNKVFVVYGHNKNARTQLEAMLLRWHLEPVILDQLPSRGQTIIEKLEELTSQVSFAIVLATPDDVGCARLSRKKNYRPRVRQNVILELGMLLAKLGRSRVAILLNTKGDLEKPSDIDGLIYLPFQKSVEETTVALAKTMNDNGYGVDISKL